MLLRATGAITKAGETVHTMLCGYGGINADHMNCGHWDNAV